MNPVSLIKWNREKSKYQNDENDTKIKTEKRKNFGGKLFIPFLHFFQRTVPFMF